VENSKSKAPTNQRPFHICPECNAYNAKFNATCWRCNHDMTVDVVTPGGVLGYRLEKLDAEAKDKTAKKD
jgi:hypothetical protein